MLWIYSGYCGNKILDTNLSHRGDDRALIEFMIVLEKTNTPFRLWDGVSSIPKEDPVLYQQISHWKDKVLENRSILFAYDCGENLNWLEEDDSRRMILYAENPNPYKNIPRLCRWHPFIDMEIEKRINWSGLFDWSERARFGDMFVLSNLLPDKMNTLFIPFLRSIRSSIDKWYIHIVGEHHSDDFTDIPEGVYFKKRFQKYTDWLGSLSYCSLFLADYSWTSQGMIEPSFMGVPALISQHLEVPKEIYEKRGRGQFDDYLKDLVLRWYGHIELGKRDDWLDNQRLELKAHLRNLYSLKNSIRTWGACREICEV